MREPSRRGMLNRPRGMGAEDGRTAAYRRIILSLVNALCEVPRDIRDAWKQELCEKGDALSPEETIIQLVLINLGVGEHFAERRKQEMLPKLYPMAGRGQSVGRSDGGAPVKGRDMDRPAPGSAA